MVNYLGACLFFSSQAFSRISEEIAKEYFMPTTLSPSHAYLLHAIVLSEGISPSKLASIMCLSPSTVTRLVDKLVYRGLVEREFIGKTSNLKATKSGVELKDIIEQSMQKLNSKFIEIFGEQKIESLNLYFKEFMLKLNSKENL